MNDTEITRLVNRVVRHIYNNIEKDCLPVFQKYYNEVDLRMEIRDFITDKYEALIDTMKKNGEILYNRYLISNSFRDTFLKILYTTVSLRLLKESAKMSMDISFNDFNFECKHRMFADLGKTVDAVIYNTTTYFADSYMLEIFEGYTSFAIKVFKKDFESAIKLVSGKKKKTRKKFIDSEFKRLYGISFQTANDIYVNLNNDISLYGFLTKLFEKRKEKIVKLPEEVTRSIGVKTNYCTKEWINEMVEKERQKLIELSEKFPSYTKERIEREIKNYRRYLELKCSDYAESRR
ncbi:MAG: hypothetical protein DRN17_03450 [Thermoplasmata archaeon]|nr:MAG: hypothetical protein DRN17_03450 [Thermoplasmata archaeon]